MTDSPRPDELGEQRTPVAPEPDDHGEAADPRSEPGARGALARVPLWFIVGAVLLVAVLALYLAGVIFPPQ